MGKRKSGNGNYYKFNKKFKKGALEVGMRGFLCTCNAQERECVREAYNILGSYSEKLYGEEELVPKNSVGNDNDDDSGNEKEKEIEDELKKEVESLKSNHKNYKERRFQVVDSGANNCVFIKTILPDPVELVNEIMRDVERIRQKKSRYLLRMLPVEVTCKAYLDDIKKECEKLFEKHFKCDPITYGIVYNKRYNENLVRSEVIESLALLIQDRNILHKVDLKLAKKTVVIEIIKNICCISVVPDYYQLKRYNLHELSKKVEACEENKVSNIDENFGSGKASENVKANENGKRETHSDAVVAKDSDNDNLMKCVNIEKDEGERLGNAEVAEKCISVSL